MKVKSDYVTNSSSTSFILIDVRKDKNKPIVVTSKIQEEIDAGEVIDTTEKLQKIFLFKDMEEYDKESYLKIKKEIEDGNSVRIATFDDNDRLLSGNTSIEDLEFPLGIKLFDNIGR